MTAGEREDGEADGTPPDAPPLATAWRSVRAHVVLVVVLAFAVRNAQAMDAVRLLATDSGLDLPGVAVLASAIAVLAVAIRYLTELVGREVGQLVYVPEARPPAATRTRVRAAVFGFVGEPETSDDAETDRRIWFGGGIGALAVVMAAFLDAPGLLIPVGIWVVVELLSIPLRPAPDVGAASPRRRRAGKRFAVVASGVVLLVGAAWPLHRLVGAAGVRWLLAALGAAVTFVSLIQLIPLATMRSSWFGLRPVLRTCCGLIPLCRVIVPGVGRRCLVAARWFVRSVLRRLVLPGVWLLERIGVRSALTRALGFCERVAARFVARLTGRGTRSDEPTAVGAAPPDGPDRPGQPAPLPSGPANAALTALHASSIGRVLGALVPMLLGAAVMRAALGLVLYAPQRNGGTWLLLVGAALVLAGPLVHGLPRLRTSAWGRGDGIAAVSLALSALFVTYLVGWQLIEVGDVIESSRRLGALGVLALGLAMLAVVVTTIAYLGDATVALPSLDLLRIRRSPFFAFALVWLLVAGVLDGGGYHSIDTRPTVAGAERATVTARTAFEQWAAECTRPADGREAVPMVFVAATGGGIRAGYWTARALERFDEHAVAIRGEDDPCRQPIFAASGASGGSVGLATYAVQHLVDADGNPERVDADGDGDPDGVADRLSEDYLAPTVAWMLMADLVRPFFLWDANGDATTDRAGVLERAMQGSWTPTPVDGSATRRCGPTEGNPDVSIASGLRELWCLGSPLVILNGAEVNSACRFNASVLDNSTAVRRPNGIVPPSPSSCRRTPVGVGTDDVGRGPLGATIDLDDYLCEGQDVAMSTAALLSARFPFITPSGRVPACDGTGLGTSYVVDGGYLDNSGSASLVELWAEVSTYVDQHNAEEGAVCIVPFFIQIDNGYEFDSGASPGRPSELTLPLSTVFASRGSRESEAKQVAASIFSTPAFSGDRIARDAEDRPLPRWARIVPDAHPGVQAPLGWALSDAARADLDEQLDRELDPEDGAFATIDRWLDPGIDCGR